MIIYYYMTVFHVCSTTGNDNNTGSDLASSLATIQAAANLAKPGDTILVEPGIYRERVAPPIGGTANAPITYKSRVKGSAIIRGSQIWQHTNAIPCPPLPVCGFIYSGYLPNSFFQDTTAIDGANPFTIPSCVTPYGRNGAPEAKMGVSNSDTKMVYSIGQVFANDQLLIQCPYYVEMAATPGSWYCDVSSSAPVLYIHYAPNPGLPFPSTPVFEITNQRRLFAPHIRGLRYIVVDGFTMERCANHYPNQFWSVAANQQAGAIGTRSGRYWTIKNNTIRFANGIGIDWGVEGSQSQNLELQPQPPAAAKPLSSVGHTIIYNHICDNGAAGTASYMGQSFTFSYNIVERNNSLGFYGPHRWESAGVKVHKPSGATLENNVIRNNNCHGIWSDQGAGVGSLFKSNLLLDNSGSGINFEIGSNTSGVVATNIFSGNQYGVSFVTSGGVAIQNNLFMGSKVADIYTNLFTRTADIWDSANVDIDCNLFYNGSNTRKNLMLSAPLSTIPSTRFLNSNSYNGQLVILPPMNQTSTPPVSYTLDIWQNLWNKWNVTDYDEYSVYSTEGVGRIVYDPDAETYSIILSRNLPQPFAKNPYDKDFFGNSSTNIIGPFSTDLSNTIIFPLDPPLVPL